MLSHHLNSFHIYWYPRWWYPGTTILLSSGLITYSFLPCQWELVWFVLNCSQNETKFKKTIQHSISLTYVLYVVQYRSVHTALAYRLEAQNSMDMESAGKRWHLLIFGLARWALIAHLDGKSCCFIFGMVVAHVYITHEHSNNYDKWPSKEDISIFNGCIDVQCQGMIWGDLGGSNRTEENFASMDYAIYRFINLWFWFWCYWWYWWLS